MIRKTCIWISIFILLDSTVICEEPLVTWSLAESSASWTELDAMPHRCIEDLSKCTDGFTVTVRFKPVPVNASIEYVYTLSSGGQTSLSNGFYVRHQYEGKECEVAVAVDTEIWKKAFYISNEDRGIQDSYAQVSFSWKSDVGLVVYVDSFVVASEKTGVTRVSVPSEFDPFPRVAIGVANDDKGKTIVSPIKVTSFVHWSKVLSAQEVESNTSNGTLIGCLESVKGDTHELSNEDTRSECRQYCHGKEFQVSFLKSKSCVCSSFEHLGKLSIDADCSSADVWHAYVVSHFLTDVKFPINLEVSKTITSGKPYIKPGDSVSFTITTDTNLPVTVDIMFGDGEKIVKSVDQKVSHSYQSVGTYTLTVMATSPKTTETKELTVDVQNVDESVGPLLTEVYAKPSGESRGFDVFINVVSEKSVDCVLDYGDSHDVKIAGLNDWVNSHEQSHTYDTTGAYEIQLSCSNKYGSKSSKYSIEARNLYYDFENIEKGKTIILPVTGSADEIVIKVHDTEIEFNVFDGGINVPASNFKDSGQYLLKAYSGETVVYTKVANIQRKIGKVNIKSSKNHVLVDEEFKVTITMETGDYVHTRIDLGGDVEYIYTDGQSNPLTIERTISFADLGYYTITAEFANDVSYVEITDLISVERPIEKFTLDGTDVVVLGTPTVFTLHVDADVKPARPFFAKFDYDNGFVEDVRFDPTSETSQPMTHQYSFPGYGHFDVMVIVSNNMSRVIEHVSVQVGHDLTYVDMTTHNERIMLSDEVAINIHTPTGSPVSYLLDMGDGTVYDVRDPTVTSKTSEDNGSGSGEESGGGIDAGLSLSPENNTEEKNKQLLKDNYSFLSDNYTNRTKTIHHTFKKTGLFQVKVKVSNPFGEKSTTLCPQVLVAPKSARSGCQRPEVTLKDLDTSRDSPFEIIRSDDFTIDYEIEKGACGSRAVISTWKVIRFEVDDMGDELRRPELAFCASGHRDEKSQVIPGNTLWYGRYMVEATFAFETKELISSTVQIHIHVRASPLVPIMVLPKRLLSEKILSIDLESSHDPDVIQKNKTGMTFHLFCYAAQNASEYNEADLDTMLTTSDLISNKTNRLLYDTAHCFSNTRYVEIVDYTVVMLGAYFSGNASFVFRLFVTKDSRISSLNKTVEVIPYNLTNIGLNDIDDALARGDATGALMGMKKMTEDLGNSSDARKAQTASLIQRLNTCAGIVKNPSQTVMALDLMGDVTKNKDDTSTKSKGTASAAMDTLGDKTKNMDLGEKGLDTATGIGKSLLNVAVNVLPTDKDIPQTTDDKKKASVVIDSSATEPAAEEEEVEEPCCEMRAPFCEFITNMKEREATMRRIMDDDELVDDIIAMQHEGQFKVEEFCDSVDFTIFEDYMVVLRKIELEEKLALEEELRDGGNRALGAVESVTGVVQGEMQEDLDVQMSAPGFSVNLTSISSKTARRKRRSASAANIGGFSLPAGALPSTGGLKAQTKDIKNSPFVPRSTEKTSVEMKTPVVALDLKDENNEPLIVQDLESPIEIPVETGITTEPELTYNPFMTSLKNTSHFQYHPVYITQNDSAVKITLIPNKTTDFYRVYLKYNGFPNLTYNDFNCTLPKKRGMEERFSCFIPQNHFPINGTYRLGVTLIEAQTTGEQFDVRDEHGYSLSMFVTKCAFWNESTEVWESRGCKVGPKSTFDKTQCLCNHLTSFGGDMVVPPNTIDFNTVWAKFKDLNENAAVFSTVVTILGLYVISLIWGRYKDKQDIIKWGALPLEDNLPTDVYHYQFTVFTGVGKSKGTKSKISFIMSGDDGDTGVRRLVDGKRNELPSGSIYNYILSVEHCLGPLTYLRIWHDNTGKGKMKGWYLDQVQIVDLQTGEKFFFLNDRWLAVEEDDGMVERIIPVAGMEDLCAFKHLFSTSMRKKLTNDHLWFSVVSRPTRSSFTRVQRISCCVSLLFMTMITNCMWFKSDDRVEQVSVLRVGPFKFTLHQLFISVVSTLIVFPVNLIIVTIFKKARPKHNTIGQMNQQNAKRSNRFKWRTLAPDSNLWNSMEQQTRFEKFKDSMDKIVSQHTRSKYEADDMLSEAEKRRKKKQGFSLPHWFMYIAWILCFFSVMTSAFFTILYSMEWGKDKSNEWLVTFLLSFFQSVIVVQPVKVLLLAAFISCILRKPELDDDDGVFDEINNVVPKKDEEMVRASEINLQEIITRRKMAASEIQPPDTSALEAAREQRMKEIQMEAILKECLSYFFFLLVLFFLSYQTRDSVSYPFVTNLRNTFFETSPAFTSVKTPDTFWIWMHAVLLPNMYSGKWYNGNRLKWREALQIDDRATIRVGIGRLRQLRIKNDTCETPPIMTSIMKHCRSDYGWINDDTSDYLPSWQKPSDSDGNSTQIEEDLKNAETPWVYQNSLQLKGVPYLGTINTYKGGGYVANFKRDYRRTVKLMKQLEKQEWVNVNTRGLLVEFTLYNANVNLFASVIMLAEFLSTGSTVTRTEIKVFRLSGYVGGFGIIVIIFEVVYLCFTLSFIYKMIKQLRKERLKYFRDFWNMLEFTTLVLSVVAIAMYAMKKVFGLVAIDALHSSGSRDYVNFVTIAMWDELFCFILACVVFVSTIKFIKLLKFNRRMGMLGDTIRLATKDLKTFSLSFTIYFMAFAQFAYLVFGRVLATYETFIGVIEALFNFCLGSFDFHAYMDAQPVIGPIFFFLFVGVVYIGLMGMFLTIIAESFTIVKENTDLQSNDYEIVDFAWRKFKGIFGWGSTTKKKKNED